ncbi:ABC transporter permease [Sediminibacterium sp.]|uniref:ABC transporter permease n=1 Tax=Sediminibacterium sp. TaxID=1917865 RepID=UPI002731A6E6|nr:ABC transporter permease [Sediminibacterium sp.]MDP2421381.1 ABC transporter permease [Sediminibacterium sp.]
MKKFIQLSGVEFKRIFSNGVVMVIFFGAPLLYGLLFGVTYKKGKIDKLSIAVVDYDGTTTSYKIIDAFNDNEYLKVAKVYTENQQVKAGIIQQNYQAIITIPQRFEADINQRRYPEITVDLNMSNILTANFVSRGLQTVLASLNAGVEIETLKKQGLSPALADARYEAFKVTYNRLFNTSGNYLNFMWPGLMGAIMQQIFLLALALVFARDFEDGYFAKLIQYSRISLVHILLKALPFYLMGIIVWGMAIFLHHGFYMSGTILNSGMLAVTLVFTTACILLGMLFSILIPNQLRATELLMVIATPGFVLSGYTWPASGMPAILQSISNALPLTHFLNAFRKIAIYGGTYSDIKNEMCALTWMSVIFFVLIVISLQVKIWKWTKKETKVNDLVDYIEE